MEKATQLIDKLLKVMTPPPGASFSESVKHYTKGIELMKQELDEEYVRGYQDAAAKFSKAKIDHQVKNN